MKINRKILELYALGIFLLLAPVVLVADQLLDASRNNHHDAIDMANSWSHSSFGKIGGNESPGEFVTCPR